jgi:hypothetical protein
MRDRLNQVELRCIIPICRGLGCAAARPARQMALLAWPGTTDALRRRGQINHTAALPTPRAGNTLPNAFAL